MGSGAAVVSTPYWYAKELLAGRRGRLFGFGDVEGLRTVLGQLLADEQAMARAQRSAYAFGRQMIWRPVGLAYVGLARRVLSDAVARAPRPARKRSLPELRLDHLNRMTDERCWTKSGARSRLVTATSRRCSTTTSSSWRVTSETAIGSPLREDF